MSESSKTTVQLQLRKLALPRGTRTATRPTVTAFPPRLIMLVGVWEKGQRPSRVADGNAVEDGYGRMTRRREVRAIWRGAAHV
jgi:hypothetical protein